MSWRVVVGSCVRPFGGAPSSGDAVFSWREGARGLYALIDALGHGPDAEVSAQRAASMLLRHAGADLGGVFDKVHAGMQGVRGVVMSAIAVNGVEVSFCGVGNVDLLGPADISRPPCMAGVLGVGRVHLRVAPLPVTDGCRWGLVSDGIRQRDARTAWEDARNVRPMEAARLILQQAGRKEDDASVLVLDFHASEA